MQAPVPTRSSYKDLCKIMQGPLEDPAMASTRFSRKDLRGTSDSISLGSPQGLLTRTRARSCKDLLEHFIHAYPHKIFLQGIVKDTDQDLHPSKRIAQDRRERTYRRRSFVQEPFMGIPEELKYKHPKDRAPSRSSLQVFFGSALHPARFHQDLHNIFSQGPVQNHARTS